MCFLVRSLLCTVPGTNPSQDKFEEDWRSLAHWISKVKFRPLSKDACSAHKCGTPSTQGQRTREVELCPAHSRVHKEGSSQVASRVKSGGPYSPKTDLGIHACHTAEELIRAASNSYRHGHVWEVEIQVAGIGPRVYGLAGAEGLKAFYNPEYVARYPAADKALLDNIWTLDVGSCFPYFLSDTLSRTVDLTAWSTRRAFQACRLSTEWVT